MLLARELVPTIDGIDDLFYKLFWPRKIIEFHSSFQNLMIARMKMPKEFWGIPKDWISWGILELSYTLKKNLDTLVDKGRKKKLSQK